MIELDLNVEDVLVVLLSQHGMRLEDVKAMNFGVHDPNNLEKKARVVWAKSNGKPVEFPDTSFEAVEVDASVILMEDLSWFDTEVNQQSGQTFLNWHKPMTEERVLNWRQ